MRKKLLIALTILSLVTAPAFALVNWGESDWNQQMKSVFNTTTAQTNGALKIGGLTATGAVTADTVVANTSASMPLLNLAGASPLVFDGATADANKNTFSITDPTAARTTTFPDATGTVALISQAVLAPSSTITWTPASTMAYTLVPAQAETINAVNTGAANGTEAFLVITTSGTSSFTLTFGTNFKTYGTLETGTTSGVVYVVDFIFDGTNWNEVSRWRSGSQSFALTPASTIALGWADGITQYTVTPAQAETINAAVVGRAGTAFDVVITTSGTSSFTMTFGTNFKSIGTLETGTTTAIIYTVHFVSDGTNWDEMSRTRSGPTSFALTPNTTIAVGYAEGLTEYTDTPAQATTFNFAVVGRAGAAVDLVLTTSGTTSFTMTFGTNTKSMGTLETGTVTAIVYTVRFVSDGTNWNEVSRKRAGAQSFALVDAPTIALGAAEGLAVYTYTPAQTNTINCTVVPRAGHEFSIVYTTSGASSFTTTFGTNFKTTGTLASGASSGKVFVIKFVSDGTNMNEVSRTTAM